MYSDKFPLTLKDGFTAGFALGIRTVVLDIPIGGVLFFIFEWVQYATASNAAAAQGDKKPFLLGFGIGGLISLVIAFRSVIRDLRKFHSFRLSRSSAAIPGVIVGVASATTGVVGVVAMTMVMILGLLAAPAFITITIIVVLD